MKGSRIFIVDEIEVGQEELAALAGVTVQKLCELVAGGALFYSRYAIEEDEEGEPRSVTKARSLWREKRPLKR